jgi:acyl-CoA-binding protein
MVTMDVKVLFDQAAAESQNLSERPSNETLLQLYGLYKQATEGDVNVDPPSNPFDYLFNNSFSAF